jgi:Mrp family chromosome partitioning ATPase
LVSELEPRLAELERKKELEEANYKYFQASLEKARIDETLDPSRMPNISVVQKPSAAVRTTQNLLRIVFGLAGGGLALGIASAMMIELVFDQTLKRPLELETRLSIPLLLSIPDFARNGHARQRLPNGSQDALIPFEGTTGSTLSSWDNAHFFRPFCEAIRDRLVLFFELNEMTHKPKLVAVTGLSKGAGASTLAAGIAAALSETSEEKVLFVDMNTEDLNDHPCFSGRQACSLSDVLQTGSGFVSSGAENNLFFATATASPNGSQRFAAKKFYGLVPQFKASDFDYVIFDMPPLSESSAALAMACFMDKVLLVVEAEKSNRELARRSYGQLTAAKANVSTVFNKSRSYGPKWLENEV